MTAQLIHLARRVLRFLWIAALWLLGAAALASLLLVPVSFITPFTADAAVTQAGILPYAEGEIDPTAEKGVDALNVFFSSCRVALICGDGGARLFVAGKHVRAPGAVTDPPAFDADLRPGPVGYPGARDAYSSTSGIGPSWLGMRWSHWSAAGRYGTQTRNGYVSVVAPMPLVALVCGLLPGIKLALWWRRRRKQGQGFPVVIDAPASREPSPEV